jgi:glycosyltransferase involved in cell wall biosynthesis
VTKALRILGTRGIPGGHGGFETFAEDLAPFLVQRGWAVTVYCQAKVGKGTTEAMWRGVRLVQIPVRSRRSLGSVVFDLRSTRHALSEDGLALVCGYNTAVLIAAYRLFGIPTLLNLDGLEWQRRKYNSFERAWFIANEWIGVRAAAHLIADHPEIEARYPDDVQARRVTTIPYGSAAVVEADADLLTPWGLTPDSYALVIARPVPENSILEIVRTYSACRLSHPLVIVGGYDPSIRYHRSVLEASGPDVRFLGPIYERPLVHALRYHATLYIHGHQVGGTNPSLVEALGAGSPVLAHDNRFNRWTCDGAAVFFRDERQLRAQLERLLRDVGEREELRRCARARHASTFVLERRLEEYEQVLLRMLNPRSS